MNERKLVEIFHNKKILTSLCLKKEKSTLYLMTEEGDEVKVYEEKVLSSEDFRLSPDNDRSDLISSLRQISLRREEIKEKIAVSELWEVCRGEQEEFTASELCELYFGSGYSSDEFSAMNRMLNQEKIFFKRSRTGYAPASQDQVDAYFLNKSRQEEKQLRYEAAGMNFKSVLEGRTKELTPAAQGFIPHLEDVCIKKKESPKYRELMELFTHAGITSKNAPFDILVRSGLWSEDENLLLREYGISREFPEEVCTLAGDLALSPCRFSPDYVDCCHLNAITIDDEMTKDFDDALSVQVDESGLLAGVHIADISSCIPRDSPLDREAQNRGTSIYLPDLKIEMIPGVLSESFASLVEGEQRRALSFFIKLDSEGNVIGYWIKNTIICVRRRMTYDEADEHAGQGGDISALYRIAQKLLDRRISAGALYSPIPRIYIRIADDGAVLLKRDDPSRPGQVLVSELMILANSIAGSFCEGNDIPAIYRGQSAPDEKVPDAGRLDPVTLFAMRRFLKKGTTDITPHRHHGLGVEHYVQITSPIRRYGDLIMQRQIKHYLESGEALYSCQELSHLIELTERSLEIAAHLERDRKSYWILKFLEKMRGQRVGAVVLKLYHEKMLIQLIDTLYETDCLKPKGTPVSPGDEITVTMESVWPREGVVRVSFESKNAG